MTTPTATIEELAKPAAFQRQASGRARIEAVCPRRPVSVRWFYGVTTALAPANPWQAALSAFQKNGPGVYRPSVSRAHGGVAA